MDSSEFGFQMEAMVMVSMSPDELRELIPQVRPDLVFEQTPEGGLLTTETLPQLAMPMRREFKLLSPGNGRTLLRLQTSVESAGGMETGQLERLATESSQRWLGGIAMAARQQHIEKMIDADGGVPINAHVDIFGTYSAPQHEILSRLQEQLGEGASWDPEANCLTADRNGPRGRGSMVRRIWLTPTSDEETVMETHVEVNDVVPASVARPGIEDAICDQLRQMTTSILESVGPLVEESAQAGRACPQLTLGARPARPEQRAARDSAEPETPRYVRPAEPRRRAAARSSQPSDWLGIG